MLCFIHYIHAQSYYAAYIAIIIGKLSKFTLILSVMRWMCSIYKIGCGNKTKITFRLNKNSPISSSGHWEYCKLLFEHIVNSYVPI